jgi:hypothetical protein
LWKCKVDFDSRISLREIFIFRPDQPPAMVPL